MDVSKKIAHLRSLGFSGDLTQIQRMYSGLPFDRHDNQYLSLISYSKNLCKQYSDLCAIPLFDKNTAEQTIINNQKNLILDKLFIGHGPLIGVGDNISAVVGMVDLNGLTYINHNVTFSPDTLVKSGDYCLIAPNVIVGEKVADNEAVGKVEIGNDVWLCADVKVGNNCTITNKTVVGLGAIIPSGTKTNESCLYVGVPAKPVLKIESDYKTKTGVKPRSKEEINLLVNHLQQLGFSGDFTQYVKMLKGEKYNSIQSTMSQISDFTHNLCAEYNNSKTSIKRKEDIINILFPIKGKNCSFGDKLFVDVVGSVSLGDNVIVKNGVSFAGNVKLGNNVVVGNNSTLFATGHEVFADGRHLGIAEDDGMQEINTAGYIEVSDKVKLGDNCKIVPNVHITSDIPCDVIYTKTGKLISLKQQASPLQGIDDFSLEQ